MKSFLLSTFLISLQFTGVGACKSQQSEPYYIIYDRAVNAYFKKPQNKKKAFSLLSDACNNLEQEQALSCYNLGLLYELDNQPDSARSAYSRATELSPNPLYQAAFNSLQHPSSALSTPYLTTIRRMQRHCQQEEPAAALAELKNYVSSGDSGSPGRAPFSQPFFENCLGKKQEYRELLDAIPEQKQQPRDRYYRTLAQEHPFSSIWDVELYFKKEFAKTASSQPLSRSWQKILTSARKGDSQGVSVELRNFYKVLQRMEKSGTDSQKLVALRRASALLIKNDYIFKRVRKNAEVQEQIEQWLK